MEKTAKLEKAIEIFVLITFPIALIVGCTSSGNVQPELEGTQDISAIEQRYEMGSVYPLFANDDDNSQVNNADVEKKAADVVATIKDNGLISESNSELTLTDGVAEKNETIVESDTAIQSQPALLVLADTSEDVLVAGANSTLALMNDIEMQPNYLVFNFDSDSAKVHEYDRYFLKQHADYLNSNPNLILKIRGHTDSRGSQIYNEELSRRRADAVKILLVSFGAPKSQIQMKGFGEIIPLNNESKMQENRRVELDYIDSTMMSAK